MKDIKISIIVVCKNELIENINHTFNSIINQTINNKELIVIDGGSKKNILEHLNSYNSHISLLISERDEGIFDAMNKGVKLSKGDWIIFMNIGDSFYDSKVLDNIANIISYSTDAPDIIYGDAFHMDGIGLRKAPRLINKYTLIVKGICHQAMLINRRCFSEVGVYDTSHKIGGDPDWNIRAYKLSKKFYYSNKIICNYMGNGLSSDSILQQKKYNRLKNKYFNRLERFILTIYLYYTKVSYRLSNKYSTGVNDI